MLPLRDVNIGLWTVGRGGEAGLVVACRAMIRSPRTGGCPGDGCNGCFGTTPVLVPRGRRFAPARFRGTLLLLPALMGCIGPAATTADPDAVLTSAEILRRCAAAYADAQTLSAAGLLRDYRGDRQQVKLIRWDLQRPYRCRLQIEMDVMILGSGGLWIYRSDVNRFASRRAPDGFGLESATADFSAGIPFLLPLLWSKSEQVLGAADPARGPRWRLKGPAWHAERPCYRMTRDGRWGHHAAIVRIWIDQDDFLIRGWSVELAAEGAEPVIVCGCSYFVVTADAAMPDELFHATPPKRIVLPRSEPNLKGEPPG